MLFLLRLIISLQANSLIDLIFLSLNLFSRNSQTIDCIFNKHLLFSTLTILFDDLCAVAFQLLTYQKEFSIEFSTNLQNTLNLIKSIKFKSITVKFRERQIRSASTELINFSFSSNWIIDKTSLRAIIKAFLKEIIEYRTSFQESRESKKIATVFTFSSTSTKNKFSASSVSSASLFNKHIKYDSLFDDIFIVWSNLTNLSTMISSEQTFNQSFNQFFEQNLISNLNIIESQMQTLSNVLTVAVDTKINRLEIEFRQLLQTSAQSQISALTTNMQRNDDQDDSRSNRNWTFEKMKFFDSTAEESNSVINLRKHVFYRNVYAFVNRLKNVSVIRKKNKLRVVISQCLRNIALIWHFTELFDVEKKIYRDMSLQNWCNVLIKRFKKRASATLNYLQSIKYTLKDARKHKDSRIFAQNLFKHVKIANFTSIYNQLILIWNNLDWQFRQHVFQLIEQITIQTFLKQLDNNCDIWFELISAFSNQTLRMYAKRFFTNKSFYQNAADRNTNRNFNQSSRSFTSRQDNAYQNNQNRIERAKMKIIIKIENQKKINERDFDKKKQINTDKRRRNDRSFENDKQKQERAFDRNEKKRYRDEKLKIKAYVIENEQNFENECSDYHQFEELSYFDSNYDFDESDDSEITVLANTIDFVCRRCIKIFASNNQFHHHLRIANCDKLLRIAIACSNSIVVDVSLIHFTVDSNKDIETEYDFKEWQYVIVQVSLFSEVKSNFDCIDSETEIILMNEKFFNQKIMNVLIKIMTTSISVKDLKAIKHSTNKYAMLSMYFSETNSSDTSTKTVITREIHLVDDLKANLLIKNDILDSKQVDIFNSTEIAFIDSCDVTISITTRTEVRSQIKSIHALKAVTVLSKFECLISIHHMFSLSDRDFFFESVETTLIIYAHLMNLKTSFILIRNDRIQFMKILRNFRLKTIKKFDYSNAYQVDSLDVSELALRHSKFEHKNAWFHKIIAAYRTICHNIIIFATIDVDSKKILKNEIIIHDSFEIIVRTFIDLINEYFKLWIDKEFADLSMKNWMRISLKSNWENKIKDKVKIYLMSTKDRKLFDDTFDKLHEQKKLSWTKQSTSFSFSCFVVWRDFVENKKDRVVIDIRSLNAMIQSDAYFVSLQSDILMIVSECHFISVIDCVDFFYQWRVHSADRHKFTVVIHRDKKSFNVTVMNYKNSSAYVQRQINRILKHHRNFAKAYVNDIVIFSKSLTKHTAHLKQVFDVLIQSNISINFNKTFFDFFSVKFLDQHVTFFEFSTNTQKLHAIANLIFSRNLTQLEIYLDLTNWFRQYIKHYAVKSKFLQLRKTRLLKTASKSENAKKSYAVKIKVTQFTKKELNSFKTFQQNLFKSTYLIHFDLTRQLYVDLNFSDTDINAMIYHVFINMTISEKTSSYSLRNKIQSIMFLSRFLNEAKSRYWSIELEIAELVWVLRKIRHLMKSIKMSTIIYTDYDATLNIAKQISLITSSTNKLNLRLIRVSNYIQRFSLNIRHKSEKFHTVSDALSRLSAKLSTSFSSEQKSDTIDDEKLDVLHTASTIEISFDFKSRIIENYKQDSDWIKIENVLNKFDNTSLLYVRKNDLIYRKKIDTNIAFYVSQRMCAFFEILKDIFSMIHDVNDHFDFDRTYKQIIFVWYIRDLIRHLKNYLKHCSKCQINQIRRHKSYDNFQSILSSSTLFHIITIDFVLTISFSHIELNNVMSITCKYSKRITIVLDKNIWSAKNWTKALLKRLNIADWEFPKIIISNRDRKFLSELWTKIFTRLDTKLLYSTTYHSQTDDSSERINQTLEIALKYHI